MSQETSTEDLTILAAIESLEQGTDPSAMEGRRGDETAETLARLYTEVLGLIPAELEPVAPGAGSRERLLAAIGAAPAVSPAPEPLPAPVQPAPAPPVAVPESVRPTVRPAPGPVPRRHSPWPLALAAALALVFAGTSVWLWMLQQRQSTEIAALRQEMATQRDLAARAGEEGRQARTEMEKMRDRFTLVTSPAVLVRPLRPVSGETTARGMLFVAPDHQHWFLSVEGLPPVVEGGVYKLWWVTAQGPQDGGSLVTQSGEKVQMSSNQMPTGITAVMVTLEPDPAAAAPTGPEILRAEA